VERNHPVETPSLPPYHPVQTTSLLTGCGNMLWQGMADVSDFMLNFKTHRTGELYNGSWGKKSGGELDELDAEDMTMLHLAVTCLDLAWLDLAWT
jgi:hypothetical protein